MFHTVYITYRIMSNTQYNKIYKALENNSKGMGYNFYPDKNNKIDIKNNRVLNIHRTRYLQDIGFNEIILRKQTTKAKYPHPYLSMEIFLNPKKLIDSNIIKITKDKDIEAISEIFNSIIDGIDNNLPRFDEWTLKRIDYATYVITPYVKEYIKLFQRANRPSKYFTELYDIDNKKRRQKKGSFYLYSKGTAINFYDKERERIDNKEEYKLSDDDIANAKNTLRFEIQCNKPKTDYMKTKYGFETKALYNYMDLDTSRGSILYYYKKCIRTGDYYRLKDAKNKIDDAEINTRTKNVLKNTLDLISECRSIPRARESFECNKETFDRHLKKLDELGINPITIPEKWGIKLLDNPIHEIESNMKHDDAAEQQD